MPVHTVYTCDLCSAAASVGKATGNTVPLPEGWMLCMLECGEPVIPAHMGGIADAAASMPEGAQQWGRAFLESNAQPFFSNFYLCPEFQAKADIEAEEMAATQVPLDVIDGDEEEPPLPGHRRPAPVPRAFTSVPKEPT